MEMTIGANIKRLRTAKNITQEQLSVAMNVTCAAVSKWERGETYPDITLLQPLAYFFGVTIDELMDYNQEKIEAEINEVIALYQKHRNQAAGTEIITKAYHDYPNDYRIMHYYMWHIGGGTADNDPTILTKHKDEFLAICEKILSGCNDECLRLEAWNMRAKIFHAEGKTEDALAIYETKFANWYTTGGQKTEQLFAKDTDEYYFHVQRNMYELIDFAGDKFGRTVFFCPTLSLQEKTERTLYCADLLLQAYEKTDEAIFLMLARSFLCRMENDLNYRGGTDEQVIAVMDKHLRTMKKLEALRAENDALDHAFDCYTENARKNFFKFNFDIRANAVSGRRGKLLKNPEYRAVLDKYR